MCLMLVTYIGIFFNIKFQLPCGNPSFLSYLPPQRSAWWFFVPYDKKKAYGAQQLYINYWKQSYKHQLLRPERTPCLLLYQINNVVDNLIWCYPHVLIHWNSHHKLRLHAWSIKVEHRSLTTATCLRLPPTSVSR